jgi:tRNA (cmo5U34)-methyltransferase
MFLPLTVSYGIRTAEGALHWSTARRDSSRQAPDPARELGPVVQVYAGRAWGWRGAFGVHTWIATKRRGADHYVRHEVIGWGVRYGADAVRVGPGIPDTYWFGSKPAILADLRGSEVESLIDQIEAAGKLYPYNGRYAVWPGPNSNTFTAFVARLEPGREQPERYRFPGVRRRPGRGDAGLGRRAGGQSLGSDLRCRSQSPGPETAGDRKDRTVTPDTWSEADSATFLDRGKYYVPERELQIRIIAGLLESQGDAARIVELCPGEGHLTAALLERFPKAWVLALDGSEAMREATRRSAGEHRGRLEVRAFDLLAHDWRGFDGEKSNAVVTSLTVHHLEGEKKLDLFKDLYESLTPGGIFVLADLTEPPTAIARRIAAESWDEEVRRRALEIDGNLNAFKAFQADQWNYYAHFAPGADPIDKPSSLMDQLLWLREAGFADVDVHWMKAGHAIMSGRKG